MDILVLDITSSSFTIQFLPGFDGGSGSQRFLIQVIDASNSSIIERSIPLNNYQYTIQGLNDSTLYSFRIKSTNIYGESPWSHSIPVQTNELTITAEGRSILSLSLSLHSSNISCRSSSIAYGFVQLEGILI